MTIERPNQVWAADVIYIPIGTSILYLIAVIDWASLGKPCGGGVASFQHHG
jgi:hypothetical protein